MAGSRHSSRRNSDLLPSLHPVPGFPPDIPPQRRRPVFPNPVAGQTPGICCPAEQTSVQPGPEHSEHSMPKRLAIPPGSHGKQDRDNRDGQSGKSCVAGGKSPYHEEAHETAKEQSAAKVKPFLKGVGGWKIVHFRVTEGPLCSPKYRRLK